ncbi:hypothetical protein C1141_18355 [Vibrio agarivorans]|uniref:Uncharacterized protein n=3 Tax=Vibrio sagamiensis TaxID=512650 RepID=A0A511QG85_9VIBR|nr:hypothetical protein C1141_18355 [Vibrio agarivorans]GEM76207.1 hypothetical protein VSA01S_23190 [Vibrio sagamiensis NBRC 104589]
MRVKFRTVFFLILSMMLMSLISGSLQAKNESRCLCQCNHSEKFSDFDQSDDSCEGLFSLKKAYNTNTLVADSDAFFKEGDVSEPISQDNAYRNAPAIVNLSRWQLTQRQGVPYKISLESFKPSSDNSSVINLLSQKNDVYWRSLQTISYTYKSDHRVSGWKDTNALYVALNGHFFL